MYCPGCGKENSDSAAFCEGCGGQLGGIGSEGTMQPPPYQPAYQAPQYRPPMQDRLPNIPSYLGWAIAVLILCFWPTGIAAVVYAARVNSRLALGDIPGAQEASRKAKTWCWVSFIIAVVAFVIGIVVAVAGRAF
jgi:hypothetical protein